MVVSPAAARPARSPCWRCARPSCCSGSSRAGTTGATGCASCSAASRPGCFRPASNATRALLRAQRGAGRAGGRRRARADRPRPARHPRPLADGDHGQGRAGRSDCSTSTRTRARAELGDLERLSPRRLADVRATALGVRGVSLAGEIADGALGAGGGRDRRPTCPAPRTTVPAGCRELFAWTIREGVTNVVRHSGRGAVRGAAGRRAAWRSSTTGRARRGRGRPDRRTGRAWRGCGGGRRRPGRTHRRPGASRSRIPATVEVPA